MSNCDILPVLQNADQLLSNGEWLEALRLLSEVNYDESSYDVTEKIILTKINCISLAAASLSLAGSQEEFDKFFNYYSDDISKCIKDLLNNIYRHKKEKDAGKIYVKFYNILVNQFNSFIDRAIAEIKDFETARTFILFAHWHSVFCSKVSLMFLMQASDMGISIEEEYKNKIDKIDHETDEIHYHKQFERAKDFINWISNSTSDFPYFDCPQLERLNNITITFFACETLLEDIIDNTEGELKIKSLKTLIAVDCDHMNSIALKDGKKLSILPSADLRTQKSNEILKLEKQVQVYIKEYKHPPYNLNAVNTVQSTGGCYIATAVYGSYDCPEVWTLRRYRDNILAKTQFGRAFIKVYYAISPTLVKWFGNTKWFKELWKNRLDKMILNLQRSGVASTPYKDK